MKLPKLFCSECLEYTIHKVEDEPAAKIQNITCVMCNKKTTQQIITKRVKVEKAFYDEYIRREREHTAAAAN